LNPIGLESGFEKSQKNIIMNLKRIFGAILTILGVTGLIYSAVLFVNGSLGLDNVKLMITYGVLSLLFFITGISLVRTTKDEA